MKKILFALFAIMAFAMTACQDKYEEVDPGTPSNPEKNCAGTYTGTWSRTFEGTVVTGEGTVTISPTEDSYVCEVVVDCPELSLNGEKDYSIANINAAQVFFQSSTNNIAPFFTGKVEKDGSVTMSFNKIVKEGRKSYSYQYSFEGKR